MSVVFADTYYFLAQLNPQDQDHAKAAAFTQTFHGRMVTTDWVIVELADAFAQQPNRAKFVAICWFYGAAVVADRTRSRPLQGDEVSGELDRALHGLPTVSVAPLNPGPPAAT